jgi:hypothetical protein
LAAAGHGGSGQRLARQKTSRPPEDKAEKVATEQLAKAAVRLAFILTQQLD